MIDWFCVNLSAATAEPVSYLDVDLSAKFHVKSRITAAAADAERWLRRFADVNFSGCTFDTRNSSTNFSGATCEKRHHAYNVRSTSVYFILRPVCFELINNQYLREAGD